jgi:hypothetical protein
MEQFNDVENPVHYCDGSIECIDAMVSAKGKVKTEAFCEMNVFKYLWRCDKKNGLEDMKKARWYLNKAIELREQIAREEEDKHFTRWKDGEPMAM